jgi:hypothetical protein
MRPALDALDIFALFVEYGGTVGATTYQAALLLGYEPDELLELALYDVCAAPLGLERRL